VIDDGMQVAMDFFALGLLWVFIAQLMLLAVGAVTRWLG